MTRQQKLLIYLACILGGIAFIWPFAILMLFFFADMDGQFPIRKPELEE